jgi:NADH pyrophosphatase NudC (nudix superfamily)
LIKYFLSCSVCQHGIILDNNQLEQIKPIAEVNQLLIDGKITEAEYQIRVEQLGGETVSSVEDEIIEKKLLNNISETHTFCSECGAKIIENNKFCGICGAKIFN